MMFINVVLGLIIDAAFIEEFLKHNVASNLCSKYEIIFELGLAVIGCLYINLFPFLIHMRL